MLRIERRCGSMNVQNVQDVQRFNAQKIMWFTITQTFTQSYAAKWAEMRLNERSKFSTVQWSSTVQLVQRCSNVQAPEILVFYWKKLLHRAMLRSERRCGSRSRQTSNRAIARSEGSSAVPGATRWNQGKLLVKV
jgi:hypothetical protein